MEERTLSFEEVVRNLHFLPCIAEAFLKSIIRIRNFVQENRQCRRICNLSPALPVFNS